MLKKRTAYRVIDKRVGLNGGASSQVMKIITRIASNIKFLLIFLFLTQITVEGRCSSFKEGDIRGWYTPSTVTSTPATMETPAVDPAESDSLASQEPDKLPTKKSPPRKRKNSSSESDGTPPPKKTKKQEDCVSSFNVSFLNEVLENYNDYIVSKKRGFIRDMDSDGFDLSEVVWPEDVEETLIFKTVDGAVTKYVEYKRFNSPSWGHMFPDVGQEAPIENKFALCSGLIFSTITRKIGEEPDEILAFVSMFGNGRYLVDKGILDLDFGLFTILNSIDLTKIKKVGKSMSEPRTLHRLDTHLKSIAASDIERNGLLNLLKGKLDGPILGGVKRHLVSATGPTLTIWKDFDPQEFRQLCEELYALYRAPPPKELSWVREMVIPVKDDKITSALDEKFNPQLMKMIADQNYEIPLEEDAEEANIAFFKVGVSDYVPSLKDAFDHICNPPEGITIANFRDLVIHCYTKDKQEIMNFPASYCFSFEEPGLNSKYTLLRGNWYRLPSQFEDLMSDEIKGLNVVSVEGLTEVEKIDHSPVKKNEKEKTKTKLEENYIKRIVAQSNSLFLMDQRTVTGNPTQKGVVEVCDVLSSRKELIHIKVWDEGSTSGSFSHLCQQALVSCTSLSDISFRKRARTSFVRYLTRDLFEEYLLKAAPPKSEAKIKKLKTSYMDESRKRLRNLSADRVELNNYRSLQGIYPDVQTSDVRAKVAAEVARFDKTFITNEAFNPKDYTVVLALIHKEKEANVSSLPYFARLSLRDTARSIKNLGYNVNITFINNPVTSEPTK